ncbi:MAG: hypothetical protein K2N72_01855 [Oscillospiraceae bacterium]|nr:hypothetical protein [Oscillospiraceae bacterium]
MNRVFDRITVEDLYQRCIYAAIAHGIMNGKFPDFSAEQSWDGSNYSFQDFCGVRGTVSFCDKGFVCLFRNDRNFIIGAENICSTLLKGADEKILGLARNEAMLYLLDDNNGTVAPAASAAFWSSGSHICSNQTESELLELSGETLIPLTLDHKKFAEYWAQCLEMTDEQQETVNEIYELRLNSNDRIILNNTIREKLLKWFNGEIDECIVSLEEMDIFLNDICY